MEHDEEAGHNDEVEYTEVHQEEGVKVPFQATVALEPTEEDNLTELGM